MQELITSPALTAPVLFIALACSIVATYRLRRTRTGYARTVLSFTLCVFAALAFYVVAIGPYPEPRSIVRLYTAIALFLLLVSIVAVFVRPSRAGRRLSFVQVHALLPRDIRELAPTEMRALLPQRFHQHTPHDAVALVMAELSEMPPEDLRTLSPEKLRTALKVAIPRSILDQR